MLARATATQAQACFLVINGPDVVSEYLGESEAGLRGIFAAARALAPSVTPLHHEACMMHRFSCSAPDSLHCVVLPPVA